jgi:acyl phosphate:glycerol-3-phosphate acyltransferase
VTVLGVALVIGAYFVGTFPTAQLVGSRLGVDPTRSGSGNPGATNVYRTAGRRAGVLALLGDVAKGVVPTAIGYVVDGRPLAVACWIAAVLGHVYPITRGLRGGKGVATAGGGALVLYPAVAVVLILIFASVVRATRTASLGSLAMAIALPILVAVIGRPAWEVAASAAVSVLVVARHRDNIRRIARNDERPIG